MRRLTLAAILFFAISGSAYAAYGSATVKTTHGKLGTFLVGPKGHTLYLFKADKGTKSTCYDDCAKAWPPLLSGKPKAAGKTKSSLLGTTKRKDGRLQVTYKGHPLYYFIQDKKAGDTKGQNVDAFGAEWYVVAPSGKQIGK